MINTNILVEGSRGKSGIVKSLVNLLESRKVDVVGKITGKETVVFRKKEKIVIPRDGKSFLIDQENKKILEEYKDVQVKVFENQALSPYTMRVVHGLFKPEIIIIPNIRYEHQDRLGLDINEISRSFAINFKGAKKVITTENKIDVLVIFSEYCDKFGVELVVIDSSHEKIPSESSIDLLNEMLNELGLKEMSRLERKKYLDAISLSMGLKYSKKGIYYFDGSKVNDIESTSNVFNYLKMKNPSKKFIFLGYLRKDRPERTESFYPFFDFVKSEKSIEKFYFTGSGLKHIKPCDKFVFDKKLKSIDVVNYCLKNNYILFMAINGVNDFMQELQNFLE